MWLRQKTPSTLIRVKVHTYVYKIFSSACDKKRTIYYAHVRKCEEKPGQNYHLQLFLCILQLRGHTV